MSGGFFLKIIVSRENKGNKESAEPVLIVVFIEQSPG
jgi:hypothetical protein